MFQETKEHDVIQCIRHWCDWFGSTVQPSRRTFKPLEITYLVGQMKFNILFHRSLAEWIIETIKALNGFGCLLFVGMTHVVKISMTWIYVKLLHNWKLAGGFKYFFYFQTYLGRWSILTHIFQMGWFNHQPTEMAVIRFGGLDGSGFHGRLLLFRSLLVPADLQKLVFLLSGGAVLNGT